MQFRHGRATVIGSRIPAQAESQTFLRHTHSNGTLVFALLLLLMIYIVGIEEGAASIFRGMYVHEFVHDGRHLLGFPCH